MENNAPKSTREVIQDFMKMTGCSEVFLYGGAAIDRYLNPNAEIMDYDMAIKDPDLYVDVVDKLKELDFDVGNTRISFNLSTVAKHKEYGVFDLACMDIESNGIYNLEKFYIKYSEKYPLGKAVDRFGTVGALREGRIELVNNPDKEKAYDLLRRFSVLAGKYNFSLERNGLNKDTMDTIERRLIETPISKTNEHDRVRCLARFFGGILRSKDQANFVRGMGQTELMSYGYPQINKVLHNENFINSAAEQPFKDKYDLINRMLKNAEDRDSFVDEISILQKRERDREDPNVLKTIDGLMDEKTSAKRLNNKVLNPLFSHLLSEKRAM